MCLVHFVKKQTTYKIMDIDNKSKIFRNESMAKGRGVVEQMAGDNLYKCPLCGIEYDRKKYDFMDYRTMRTIKSGPES